MWSFIAKYQGAALVRDVVSMVGPGLTGIDFVTFMQMVS